MDVVVVSVIIEHAGRVQVSRLRGMKITESHVGYFEINAVCNRKPAELFLRSVCELDRKEFVTTRAKGFCTFCSTAMFFFLSGAV